MVSVRQRSADFFVRYAIVDADRQGVTGLFYMSQNAWFTDTDLSRWPGTFVNINNY